MELRAINYQCSSRQLLKRLNDELEAAGLPPFVPWTISRIGAFYLPSTLTLESEVRLLVKRHKVTANVAKNDGVFEYWPLKLGQDTWFGRIDLTEIACGPRCKVEDIDKTLYGTGFDHVSIT